MRLDAAPPPVSFAVKLPDSFLTAFLSIASGQVGNHETGRNNGGPLVRAYMSATYLGAVNDKWCAGFVCWCFLTAALRFPDIMAIRPTTPRAFEFEDWGILHGFPVIRSPRVVNPGDLVVFDFSHVGIAAGRPSSGRFDLFEGNASEEGSNDGGSVLCSSRSFSRVRSIIALS